MQPEAGWVCTMVPMQEMPLRGVGLSPAGTVIFLQSSCFVMVVGSFQLKMLSVRQGTQHFTDENKVSRNEVILSTYLHPNLIRTMPLLIEFCVSKFKTKINQIRLTPFITRHIHKLT